ncbi:MAG: hypothetical protein ACXVCI_14435 [Bdellovibrionota bacterium]
MQSQVEDWLAKIRTCLPDSGTAVVTIHKLPRHKFLVSFRASAFGETFISEARENDVELGLEAAGSRLFERLTTTPPQPKPVSLGDRVRELFGETG